MLYGGNNVPKWPEVKKKKISTVFGTGCGSDRVQGAPPPTRDLVIERVSKVPKEIDVKDHIKSEGLCVFAHCLLCRTLMPSILHLNYKYLKMM